MEKCKTAFLCFLIVLMLVAAGTYIGGAQFSHSGSADTRTSLPSGIVPMGEDAPDSRSLTESGLLSPEAVVVSAAGRVTGAFAADIPEAATALAYPLIHEALGGDATLTETARATVLAATAGNYLFLRLRNALPYQLLYALTGDIEKAADADFACSANALLLAFGADGTGRLYLVADESCFVSDKLLSVRTDALTVLVSDGKMTDTILTKQLVPVGSASYTAFPIAVEQGDAHPLSAEAWHALLMLFDFNPDRYRTTVQTVVEPHGSLSITAMHVDFTASQDGGIRVASFLETGKDARDIDIYDILTAAATVVSRLRDIDADNFGGDATPYLMSFYREGNGYTLTFGLCCDGIALAGKEVEPFLTLTTSGGMFTAATVRRICVSRTGSALTLFSAAWQYTAAVRAADANGLRRLCLLYQIDALPLDTCDAAWYCDRIPFDSGTSRSAAVTYTLPSVAESEAKH